jgi:hypothetical protein
MPAFAAWRTNCSGEPHCTPRCASRHTPPKPVTPCTQQRVSTTVAITHPITHNCHPRQARLDSSSSNQQDSRRRNLMWQRKMPHATHAHRARTHVMPAAAAQPHSRNRSCAHSPLHLHRRPRPRASRPCSSPLAHWRRWCRTWRSA